MSNWSKETSTGESLWSRPLHKKKEIEEKKLPKDFLSERKKFLEEKQKEIEKKENFNFLPYLFIFIMVFILFVLINKFN